MFSEDTSFLDLNEDEYLVYKNGEEQVILNDVEVGFFVTNRRIIIVEEFQKLFQKPTYKMDEWQISDISDEDGSLQVSIRESDFGYWDMVIIFQNGILEIGFDYGSNFKKTKERDKDKGKIENLIKLISLQRRQFSKLDIRRKHMDKIISRKHQMDDDFTQESTDDDFTFCQYCETRMNLNAVICPECERRVERHQPQQVSGLPNYSNQPQRDLKDKWVAFMLCIFLGFLGVHKFYEGKPVMGLIYLFTLGFWGIGVIIDLFQILVKPNRYY